MIWWGATPAEPDLMVVYNESPEPLAVTNLNDWSHGDWKVLVRSWFGAGDDSCELSAWQTACPDVTDRIEIKGRSMAVLVSDND